MKCVQKRSVAITVIILTLNEEKNIGECIRCLERVEDIVIIDSYSTDQTISESRRFRPDVRVFKHEFKDFGDQRSWALDRSGPRHQWVLFVDADEFCDDVLLDEVCEFVERPGDKVGAYIAGKNYFLGRWIKYSTMYPFYQLRLLKRGFVTFQKSGHGQREVVTGKTGYLRHGWRHEAFSKGISEWVDRHNRYSTDEAELMLSYRATSVQWGTLLTGSSVERRRELKVLSARVPCRPALRFLYMYIVRGGFRDGYPGLLYCLLVLSNQIHISAKMQEIKCED